MSKLFPALVFIRGPQRDQRVELSKSMNIVGRDKGCEVEVEDEYTSRQHARIMVEGARVRLVNVSPNGTKVNGKLVEQAILADGDILSFGLECEVRFESAESAAQAAGAGPGPAAAVAEKSQPAAEPSVAPKKAAKKPAMIFWVGVYLLALAALFAVIKLLTGGQAPPGIGPTVALSDDDMRGLIDKPETDQNGNPLPKSDHLAAKALDQAKKDYEAWQTGTTGQTHLYLTLRQFKLALAFQQSPDFGTAIHRTQSGEVKLVRTMMKEVGDALFDEVRVAYKNAYAFQRQGRLRAAVDSYNVVLGLIPDKKDPIVKNVMAQLSVVNAALARQKERMGPRVW